MSLIKRLSFVYRSAADWPTCLLLWWYTLLFSAAIRWPWLYRRLCQNEQSGCYQIFWDGKWLKLYMRQQDIPIFYEIFQDEAYQLPDNINIPATATLIDLGAHIGLFSLYFSQKYSVDLTGVALEPSPANYTLLQANLEDKRNITLIPKAVASYTGSVFLQTAGLSYNHRISQQNSGLSVEAINILELLEPYSEDKKLFLLKMDIEGMEAQLVPMLRSKTRLIQYLVIEIHPPYTSDQLIKDLNISASQLNQLQASTYFINFAPDESTSISS